MYLQKCGIFFYTFLDSKTINNSYLNQRSDLPSSFSSDYSFINIIIEKAEIDFVS